MKRASYLLEQVMDPDNLRLAFWKARKGRNYSQQVQAYREDLGNNLVKLRTEIESGTVEVGDYRYFKVYDPKERQICASAFSEQVLHHALMNICHSYLERVQIFHSFACRIGKGTYAALDMAKGFTKKNVWYLKLDVRKFFASIDHQVLKKQLKRLFKDWKVLNIFEKIIDSHEASPGKGLPIGNLTSQYFANHYLSGLDHFIKEQLGVKAYVRYMDDMVLWHHEKQVLKQAYHDIEGYVEEGLHLQLKTPVLNRSMRGLSFLGYRIYPFQVKLSQGSKRRFIKKMKELDQKCQNGDWSEVECQRRVLPMLAFVMHADTNKFREKVLFEINGQSS